MANPQDLEKLCQGPKIWNAWREEDSERIPDLRDARLSLSQRQFGPSNGGPVNFRRADLEGVEFRHATLSSADLRRASLLAADLVHAKLDNADLQGADLTDAVLDYADLTGTNLEGAILTGASFANVRGLTAEQVESAHGDASTKLPGELLPPQHWFPPLEDDDIFMGSPTPEEEPIHESDPYDILGVDRSASQTEIRTAFRNQVKLYHPDINPDDAHAQELFKRISIAYRILGDAEKRARYDKGEIGGDGEVSPEFEARQHFRRYAFRFYTAAAASLILAVGLLGAIWYAVLDNGEDEENRLEIAVTAPPEAAQSKQGERLDSNIGAGQREFVAPVPDHNATQTATLSTEPSSKAPASEPAPEYQGPAITTSPSPAVESQGAQTALTQPAETFSSRPDTNQSDRAAATDREEENAAESSASPRQNPSQTSDVMEEIARLTKQKVPAFSERQGGTSSKARGDTPPPLGEENSSAQTRPASADAVRSSAPTESASPLSPDNGGAPAAEPDTTTNSKPSAAVTPAQSPHSTLLLWHSKGRRIGKDPISNHFRHSALQEASVEQKEQTEAGRSPIWAQDEFVEYEEVWEIHSRRLSQQSGTGLWPEGPVSEGIGGHASFLQASRRAGLAISVPARALAVEASAPREISPTEARASLRRQAVFDILSGSGGYQ